MLHERQSQKNIELTNDGAAVRSTTTAVDPCGRLHASIRNGTFGTVVQALQRNIAAPALADLKGKFGSHPTR
jgi:hypothetical protein